MFQGCRSKVYEQTDLIPRSLQVIDDLSFFYAAEAGQRLELNDHRIETKKVSPKGCVQTLIFVEHRNFHLPPVRDPPSSHF